MDCFVRQTDFGPNPYTVNVEQAACVNENFRTAVWTGCHLQMTVMCIPPCGEIGMEMHPDTDQMVRIEQGCAMVRMGRNRCRQELQRNLGNGDAVFIPAGTWHNIVNIGRCPLKVSSVYAPPNHPRGTVQRTKEAAEY